MVKVAIIDDEPMVSNLLATRLRGRNFEVALESNPLNAIEFIKEQAPDILLLDVEMPGKNGLEVLADIRTTYSSFEMPVIMVTSHDDSEMIVRALGSGANDYITKPVTMEVAVARIETQLKLSALHLEGVKRKQLETVTAMIVTYNHEINNPLMVAYSALAKLKNGDQSALNKMQKTLDRIRDLVKKIDTLAKKEVNFVGYSEVNVMVDVHQSGKEEDS